MFILLRLTDCFFAWMNNGQSFEEVDDMGRLDEVFATGSDGENRTLAQELHDLHEVLVQGNGFSKDGYTRAFLRRWYDEESPRLGKLEKDVADIKAAVAKLK